jgi:WD40 repeat protein
MQLLDTLNFELDDEESDLFYSLDFNVEGTILVCGSSNGLVSLWNWARRKVELSYGNDHGDGLLLDVSYIALYVL